MDVATALARATSRLRASAVDGPRRESELLLACVLQVDSLALLRAPDRALAPVELERFESLVARRAAHWPLAYLVGRREFYALALMVTQAVLIPRPETELLVDLGLAHLATRAGDRLLGADVGTGSGCIAAALLVHEPRLAMIASDVSLAAACVAHANLRACVPGASRHVVVVMDGLDAVANTARLDLIVSNPPYVLESERASLAPELAFEPELALFAPAADATRIYRRLALAAAQQLKPGGVLLAEIHAHHAREVMDAVMAPGALVDVRVEPDLAGQPRILHAKKPEK